MTEVLVAILTIVLLSLALAVILLVAEAVLVNYGECTLRINDDEERVVEGGSSLLSVLMGEEIFVPSACGGRGSCGLCKVKVLEGGGPLLPTETPHLDDEEIENNVRLSCQVKVRTDMALEIPEEILSLEQYETEVTSIQDLNYDTRLIGLELIDPSTLSFTPGQYIQFECPPYGKTPEPVYRAYSVASPATEEGSIELIIRRAPGGICTTYVFEVLKEGQSINVNGPYGDFYLRDTDREIVFIAGGSGIAPIRSILSQMAEQQIERKATFFYGANELRDLYLQDELREFEENIPNLTYIPVVAEPEDEWDGETGLVTEAIDRHIEDATTQEFYLCGSPAMIDAAVELLKEKDMPDDRAFYDKFEES
jgi:Na+-transporting NADH:ubiquinone oxidoreductase subunit F